ncbi:hypothetical protein C2S51_013010 [Perilla frutescens var. frutescens]|nr:hypothetical protein C2S51_013010 [Perilla frutescens var. frutescens]
MKTSKSNPKAFAKALAMIIFLAITISAENDRSARFNSSSCKIANDEAEFATMSLASKNTISYAPLSGGHAFCNSNFYGSCIPKPNKIHKTRACSYENVCRTNTV